MDGEQQSFKKWNIIYPIYINLKKSIAEGRQNSASKACENPTCIEIGDCCNHLKIPCAIEHDKACPRDFMQIGRVRFELIREHGSPYNPAIGSSSEPRHP
ncbi:Signal recognition particle 19 kDa protein [Apostasia shenzhenica]|uniref:Signal recognition particle 19 kDa protein n=1 Tax=Apostasia shenzhenica TaxID=1088818 RepID=A0A2I0ARD7_9ASPA|nr:Signal recognition particle 19 kDa protein [Apostasia shenzhenica]